MKLLMIRIGNFFFRYRNKAFPFIILALYMLAIPPSELFSNERAEEIKDMIAVLIAFSGLALRASVIGYAYIKRGGLNKQVYADRLVTEGMFHICRNPLYTGNMLIYTGVFLMHGNPLVMALGFTSYLLIYYCIIFAEEAYLEKKFGEEYRNYCAKTPRWVPDFSGFKQATKDMAFNIKRVILKDYTTIATTIIMLALTEGYEDVTESSPELQPLLVIGLIILLAAAMVFTISRLKKSKRLTEI